MLRDGHFFTTQPYDFPTAQFHHPGQSHFAFASAYLWPNQSMTTPCDDYNGGGIRQVHYLN